MVERILVTGGMGQIGYFLVNQLLEENKKEREIVVLDNFSNNKYEASDLDKSVTLIEGDIKELPDLGAFEVIYHLAAQISISYSVSDPIDDFLINAFGTLQLLELAREHNSKIVVVSSASVFGDTNSLPVSPDTVLRPKSPYGASKATSEIYALAYHHCFDLKVAVVRPFNIYSSLISSDDPYSGVITVFMENALSDKTLLIEGDGSQTRDFVTTSYVAEILRSIVKKDNLWGEVVHIGTGKETTILELAQLIIKETNSSSEIVFGEPRVGDIYRSVADISLLQKNNLPMPKSLSEEISSFIKEWMERVT
ncbi:MAG: GDP-mannose 4,6-dehydratase [Candidatus Heimdallarchaeota archaeon]|nr:GDP-mannose 4,6-dehydratase [Candidatus Heimdallarchaeota archaeon]MCK5048279.1 GDP-mannose 4,6-dehydratase [Candidatus Heimdallarchaeota archaeon]